MNPAALFLLGGSLSAIVIAPIAYRMGSREERRRLETRWRHPSRREQVR